MSTRPPLADALYPAPVTQLTLLCASRTQPGIDVSAARPALPVPSVESSLYPATLASTRFEIETDDADLSLSASGPTPSQYAPPSPPVSDADTSGEIVMSTLRDHVPPPDQATRPSALSSPLRQEEPHRDKAETVSPDSALRHGAKVDSGGGKPWSAAVSAKLHVVTTLAAILFALDMIPKVIHPELAAMPGLLQTAVPADSIMIVEEAPPALAVTVTQLADAGPIAPHTLHADVASVLRINGHYVLFVGIVLALGCYSVYARLQAKSEPTLAWTTSRRVKFEGDEPALAPIAPTVCVKKEPESPEAAPVQACVPSPDRTTPLKAALEQPPQPAALNTPACSHGPTAATPSTSASKRRSAQPPSSASPSTRVLRSMTKGGGQGNFTCSPSLVQLRGSGPTPKVVAANVPIALLSQPDAVSPSASATFPPQSTESASLTGQDSSPSDASQESAAPGIRPASPSSALATRTRMGSANLSASVMSGLIEATKEGAGTTLRGSSEVRYRSTHWVLVAGESMHLPYSQLHCEA